MRTVIASLESTSPYSQSKHYDEFQVPPINDGKETKDAYEARTWRNRLHVDDNGEVFIPPMAFKNSLSEAAKYLSMQIPGKGKSTYTKHFEGGLMVPEAVGLGIKAEDVGHEWHFVPSNGVRGNGKRVNRCFPLIRKWAADVLFVILDETIDENPFAKHLQAAGMFIGIGRFRPRNNGFYGRFKVNNIVWE